MSSIFCVCFMETKKMKFAFKYFLRLSKFGGIGPGLYIGPKLPKLHTVIVCPTLTLYHIINCIFAIQNIRVLNGVIKARFNPFQNTKFAAETLKLYRQYTEYPNKPNMKRVKYIVCERMHHLLF